MMIIWLGLSNQPHYNLGEWLRLGSGWTDLVTPRNSPAPCATRHGADRLRRGHGNPHEGYVETDNNLYGWAYFVEACGGWQPTEPFKTSYRTWSLPDAVTMEQLTLATWWIPSSDWYLPEVATLDTIAICRVSSRRECCSQPAGRRALNWRRDETQPRTRSLGTRTQPTRPTLLSLDNPSRRPLQKSRGIQLIAAPPFTIPRTARLKLPVPTREGEERNVSDPLSASIIERAKSPPVNGCQTSASSNLAVVQTSSVEGKLRTPHFCPGCGGSCRRGGEVCGRAGARVEGEGGGGGEGGGHLTDVGIGGWGLSLRLELAPRGLGSASGAVVLGRRAGLALGWARGGLSWPAPDSKKLAISGHIDLGQPGPSHSHAHSVKRTQ